MLLTESKTESSSLCNIGASLVKRVIGLTGSSLSSSNLTVSSSDPLTF